MELKPVAMRGVESRDVQMATVRRPAIPVRLTLPWRAGAQEPAPAVGVFDERRKISAARRQLKVQALAVEKDMKERQMNMILDRLLEDMDRRRGQSAKRGGRPPKRS